MKPITYKAPVDKEGDTHIEDYIGEGQGIYTSFDADDVQSHVDYIKRAQLSVFNVAAEEIICMVSCMVTKSGELKVAAVGSKPEIDRMLYMIKYSSEQNTQ